METDPKTARRLVSGLKILIASPGFAALIETLQRADQDALEALRHTPHDILTPSEVLSPEEIFFRVQGEPQPQLAKKSEMNFDFDIHPAGTPSSTNKQFLLANMERLLPLVIQAAGTGLFDVNAFITTYFELIDRKIAKLVVRTPEQTKAAQAVMQAAQAETGEENLAF